MTLSLLETFVVTSVFTLICAVVFAFTVMMKDQYKKAVLELIFVFLLICSSCFALFTYVKYVQQSQMKTSKVTNS